MHHTEQAVIAQSARHPQPDVLPFQRIRAGHPGIPESLSAREGDEQELTDVQARGEGIDRPARGVGIARGQQGPQFDQRGQFLRGAQLRGGQPLERIHSQALRMRALVG